MTAQQIQQSLEVAGQHREAARYSEAEGIYREILAENPGHALALYWLGFVLFKTGKFAEAAEAIGRAIAIEPGRADLYGNLSSTLTSLGKYEEAIAAARRAVALKPDFGEGFDDLGRALRLSGRLDQAIAAYRQGIAAAPKFAANYIHLGEALFFVHQTQEAMAAFRQALVVRPDYAEAEFGLGAAFKSFWQLDESIAAYQRAIAMRPNYSDALMNLSNVLLLVGRVQESCETTRGCMAVAPGDPCAHSNLIFSLHYCDGKEGEIGRELAAWNKKFAEPLRKLIRPLSNDRSPDRKLRMGYLSPDFRDHPVGRFLVPLVANHDRRNFEVYCYSDLTEMDSMTDRIRSCADQWKSVAEMKDGEIAEMIRQDRIDILVDLSLHTNKNRLLVFAEKPAPVQVSYLGYCGSSGLATMDYRLTDPYFDPPGGDESGYSEKSVVLPRTWWCYSPTVEAAPSAEPPSVKAGFVTFGCQNNYCKISAAAWGAWTAILRAQPSSKLLLYSQAGSHRETARKRLADAGVNPERLVFSDSTKQAYFLRYRQIDIGLDPFPFCGGTTSCDSIWMGVPFVTLRGRTAVGRAGASILSNIGLPGLIAETIEEYIQIAIELASDAAKLAELRKGLRERMRASPLMDAAGYARDVEAAYREMWREWCGADGD